MALYKPGLRVLQRQLGKKRENTKMKGWWILSILILVATYSTHAAPSPPPPPPSQTVAMQVLTLHWPKTVCRLYHCTTPATVPSQFTVHGIWPANATGYSIIQCVGSTLYSHSLSNPLTRKLDHIWPSYTSMTNFRFWRHEWNKHGKCSTLSVTDYFQCGADNGTTFAAQITSSAIHKYPPNNNRLYNVQDVYKTLRKTLNVRPQVRCKWINQLNGFAILEIGVCLSSDFRRSIHCPSGGPQGCGNRNMAYFPST